MSDSYLGEIRMFAGNFAPAGWVLCNGQLLSIADNDALFALLGTTYGGDGVNTFAVPDLQCRIPVHQGQGPGLSSYVLGQKAGVETVTLTQSTTPGHTHLASAASSSSGAVPSPAGNVWSANANSGAPQFAASGATPAVTMAGAVSSVGSGTPHDNMAPTLAISFIMLTQGIFPTQN